MFKSIYKATVIAFLIWVQPARAIEGMWLPMLLSELNESEMKAMGFQLSASDVYDANQSSLKDAIVSFGGFCTGEVISSKGLLLTNHHCGFGQIQKHSSVERDYLKNGFWAMNPDQELQNPGLTATFVKYMVDVTNEIMSGINPDLDDQQRASQIKERIQQIVEEHTGNNPNWKYFVRPFYYGNQYILFATEVFEDVRLVGAPPSSIGKFGADTDNWMWPRHTGDFALFRIYANPNNQPAKPSVENVPYMAPRHLTINTGGVKDGDFTMVFGFPGRTEQYLPKAAVAQTMNTLNPARIGVRDVLLSQLDRRMRVSDEVRIQYAAKYASISNGWKKWKGENIGLKETDALGRKEAYEKAFQGRVESNQEWKKAYGTVLTNLNDLYAAYDPWLLQQTYFMEIVARGLEAMGLAWSASKFSSADPASQSQEATALLNRMKAFYKDYNHEVQTEAMVALMGLYVNNLGVSGVPKSIADLHTKYKGDWKKAVEKLIQKSVIATAQPEDFMALLENNPKAAAKALNKDPFFKFTIETYNYYLNNIAPEANRLSAEIAEQQGLYMKAQLEVFQEKRFFPDANSTLRVSYGKKEPFAPHDGATYLTQTYLDGVMAKYVPGDYEFDLPEKLIDLYNQKDFGPYADATGKVPVCFIASNHTTGGNSGSPALDGKGRLIGLNFDRAWEGTMSDINYDISRCRNIMVDARYILFIVDKFAGAGYLLEEMTLEKDS